jgi:predicted DNA-binding ribbon-helix-helix protein
VADLKRSLTIQGHRTSLSLEPEFWQALRQAAGEDKITIAALVEKIDIARNERNLSSEIRVYILKRLQESLLRQ